MVMDSRSLNILMINDAAKKDYTALAFSYIRAFEQLGHKCDNVAYDVNIRFFRLLYMISPVLVEVYLNNQQERIIEKASNPIYS